ncbi:uncharacterized protein LOC143021738 [Oratosquilla oratoria]|uniref:uncharacterized protein LOC143021738 n=1 Tax=Oratosquilla oratoria TaxID=337810 RepID=UPI003F775C50
MKLLIVVILAVAWGEPVQPSVKLARPGFFEQIGRTYGSGVLRAGGSFLQNQHESGSGEDFPPQDDALGYSLTGGLQTGSTFENQGQAQLQPRFSSANLGQGQPLISSVNKGLLQKQMQDGFSSRNKGQNQLQVEFSFGEQGQDQFQTSVTPGIQGQDRSQDGFFPGSHPQGQHDQFQAGFFSGKQRQDQQGRLESGSSFETQKQEHLTPSLSTNLKQSQFQGILSSPNQGQDQSQNIFPHSTQGQTQFQTSSSSANQGRDQIQTSISSQTQGKNQLQTGFSSANQRQDQFQSTLFPQTNEQNPFQTDLSSDNQRQGEVQANFFINQEQDEFPIRSEDNLRQEQPLSHFSGTQGQDQLKTDSLPRNQDQRVLFSEQSHDQRQPKFTTDFSFRGREQTQGLPSFSPGRDHERLSTISSGRQEHDQYKSEISAERQEQSHIGSRVSLVRVGEIQPFSGTSLSRQGDSRFQGLGQSEITTGRQKQHQFQSVISVVKVGEKQTFLENTPTTQTRNRPQFDVSSGRQGRNQEQYDHSLENQRQDQASSDILLRAQGQRKNEAHPTSFLGKQEENQSQAPLRQKEISQVLPVAPLGLHRESRLLSDENQGHQFQSDAYPRNQGQNILQSPVSSGRLGLEQTPIGDRSFIRGENQLHSSGSSGIHGQGQTRQTSSGDPLLTRKQTQLQSFVSSERRGQEQPRQTPFTDFSLSRGQKPLESSGQGQVPSGVSFGGQGERRFQSPSSSANHRQNQLQSSFSSRNQEQFSSDAFPGNQNQDQFLSGVSSEDRVQNQITSEKQPSTLVGSGRQSLSQVGFSSRGQEQHGFTSGHQEQNLFVSGRHRQGQLTTSVSSGRPDQARFEHSLTNPGQKQFQYENRPRFEPSVTRNFGENIRLVPVEDGSSRFLGQFQEKEGFVGAANDMFEPLNLPPGVSLMLGKTDTSFQCTERPYGYYADVGHACNIFHVCYPALFTDGHIESYQYSFLCAEGSIFDQREMTCIKKSAAFPCQQADSFYFINEKFGRPEDEF